MSGVSIRGRAGLQKLLADDVSRWGRFQNPDQSLATHLGVTYQQIQKYENGQNRITAAALVRIARALARPILDLHPDAPGLADETREAAALDPGLQVLAAEWDRLTDVQREEITQLVLALGQKNQNKRRPRRQAVREREQ